jgi:hypothetical protein
MKEPKLTIELVPTTCFFSNVRSELPKKEWDRLRKASYEAAGHKCEVCGSSGRVQGYKHPVECHEIWEYDDENKIQYLRGLISLCPRCHQVKHIGRTTVIGLQRVAFKHLEKVNGWNHREVVDYVAASFIIHRHRSQFEWKLDVNILEEQFGVDKKLVTEAHKKRG